MRTLLRAKRVCWNGISCCKAKRTGRTKQSSSKCKECWAILFVVILSEPIEAMSGFSLTGAMFSTDAMQKDFYDAARIQRMLDIDAALAAGVACNLAFPPVKHLTAVVEKRVVVSSIYVHLGATIQDVIDTGTVLQ